MAKDPINTGSNTLGLMVQNTHNTNQQRQNNTITTFGFLNNAFNKLNANNQFNLQFNAQQEQLEKDNEFRNKSFGLKALEMDTQKEQFNQQMQYNYDSLLQKNKEHNAELKYRYDALKYETPLQKEQRRYLGMKLTKLMK